MQSATTFLCVLAPLVLSAAPRPVPEISRYGSIPLYFEKNTGQADHSTLFTARSAGVSFALQQNGAALSLAGADNPARIHLEFVKSNPRVAINPEDPLEGHTNYYFGDDPNRWITGVPQFGRVRYQHLSWRRFGVARQRAATGIRPRFATGRGPGTRSSSVHWRRCD